MGTKIDIRRPLWILCTPRTGSSFLCELLNNTGLFPPFNHKLLRDRVGPLQKGLTFSEWLRIYHSAYQLKLHPPIHLKCILHQYVETCLSVPMEFRQGPGFEGYENEINIDKIKKCLNTYNLTFLESIIPDIQFVEIHRDATDQAVSTYIARSTSKYHLYSAAEQSQYRKREVNIDSYKLLEIYFRVKQYGSLWDKFAPAVRIDYRELVDDPISQLRSLGIPAANAEVSLEKCMSDDRRIFEMDHPAKPEAISVLKSALKCKWA